MAINLHLQNLSPLATNLDIRRFFGDLEIPAGGVQIIGGRAGEAFIAFSTPDDLLRALTHDQQNILGQPVRLLLVTKADVDQVMSKMEQNEARHRQIKSHDHEAGGRLKINEHSTSSTLCNTELSRRPKLYKDYFHCRDGTSNVPTQNSHTKLAVCSEFNLKVRHEISGISQMYKEHISPSSTIAENRYPLNYIDDIPSSRLSSGSYTQAMYLDLLAQGIARNDVTRSEHDYDVKRRRMSETSSHQCRPSEMSYSAVGYKDSHSQVIAEGIQRPDMRTQYKVTSPYDSQSTPLHNANVVTETTTQTAGYIQVCNIPFHVTAVDLMEFFSGHTIAHDGIIMKVNDHKPGTLNAFIKFVNMKDAIKADCICDGFKLHGNIISISLINQLVFEYQRELPQHTYSAYQHHPPPLLTIPYQYQHPAEPPKYVPIPPLKPTPLMAGLERYSNRPFTSGSNNGQGNQLPNPAKKLGLLNPNAIECMSFLRMDTVATDRTTPSSIWRKFGGQRGPCSGVIMACQSSSNSKRSFIAYESRKDRNISNSRCRLPTPVKKVSGPAALRFIKILLKDKWELLVSSETGINRSISAEEKARLIPQESGEHLEVEQTVHNVNHTMEPNLSTKTDSISAVSSQQKQKTLASSNMDGNRDDAVSIIYQDPNPIWTESNALSGDISNSCPEKVKMQVPSENEDQARSSKPTTCSDTGILDLLDSWIIEGENKPGSINKNDKEVLSPVSSSVSMDHCATSCVQEEPRYTESTNVNNEMETSYEDQLDSSSVTIYDEKGSIVTTANGHNKLNNDNVLKSEEHGLSIQLSTVCECQNDNSSNHSREANNQAPLSNNDVKANNSTVAGEYGPNSWKLAKCDEEPGNDVTVCDADELINDPVFSGSQELREQLAASQVIRKEESSDACPNVDDALSDVKCEVNDKSEQEPTCIHVQQEQMATASEKDVLDQVGLECTSNQQHDTSSTSSTYNKSHEINAVKSLIRAETLQASMPIDIFDPDITITMSYIKIFKVETAFHGVRSASVLWDVFGGATGETCLGAISVQDVLGNNIVAFLAYSTSAERDAIIEKQKNIEGKWARCSGLAVVRYLAYFCQKEYRMFASTKDLEGQEITQSERRNIEAVNDQMPKAVSGSKTSSGLISKDKIFEASIDQTCTKIEQQTKELYTYIRFDELQPKVTASEIWSWFSGEKGPSPGVTLVKNEHGDALFAYVCIGESHMCSIDSFTKKHYTTSTDADKRKELACLDPTYRVVESTCLGTGEENTIKAVSGEEDLHIVKKIGVPEVGVVKSRSVPVSTNEAGSDIEREAPWKHSAGLSMEVITLYGDVADASNLIKLAPVVNHDIGSESQDEDFPMAPEDYIVIDEFVDDSDIEILDENLSSSVEGEPALEVDLTVSQLD